MDNVDFPAKHSNKAIVICPHCRVRVRQDRLSRHELCCPVLQKQRAMEAAKQKAGPKPGQRIELLPAEIEEFLPCYKPSYMTIFEAREVVREKGIEYLRTLQLTEIQEAYKQKVLCMRRPNPNPTDAEHRSDDCWKDRWERTYRRR